MYRKGILYFAFISLGQNWKLIYLVNGSEPHANSQHDSKEMVYEVYGKYVEGLETDAGEIREYLGKDFMGMGQIYPPTFAKKSW